MNCGSRFSASSCCSSVDAPSAAGRRCSRDRASGPATAAARSRSRTAPRGRSRTSRGRRRRSRAPPATGRRGRGTAVSLRPPCPGRRGSGGLVERAGHLGAVPVAQQPDADAGDDPEEDDARDVAPATSSGRRWPEGRRRCPDDGKSGADSRPAGHGAADHDERHDRGGQPDEVLLPRHVVERMSTATRGTCRHEQSGRGGAHVLRYGDERERTGPNVSSGRERHWAYAVPRAGTAGQIDLTVRSTVLRRGSSHVYWRNGLNTSSCFNRDIGRLTSGRREGTSSAGPYKIRIGQGGDQSCAWHE